MGLDLLSFLDYSRGSGISFVNFAYWMSALNVSLYLIITGPFWYGSCREWSAISFLFSMVEDMVGGHKLSFSAGGLQLMTGLFLTLMCLNFGSLLPFNYPLTSHLTVTSSLSLPFWLATVFSYFSMNWRSFSSKFIIKGSIVGSILFQMLEVVTIGFRSVTLCARMTMNIVISLIFAKIFFSMSLSLWWPSAGMGAIISSMLGYVLAVGYYMMEWIVSFIQCWLFVALLISYVDEAIFSGLEEMNMTAEVK